MRHSMLFQHNGGQLSFQNGRVRSNPVDVIHETLELHSKPHSSSWLPNVMDAIFHIFYLGSPVTLKTQSMLYPVWVLEVSSMHGSKALFS